MNEQLLNNDLIALNNYLSHSGRPGMKWRTFGASGATRWQPGAVYAKGMSNPNQESHLSFKEFKEKTTSLINEMNDEWDYGVLDKNNQKILDTETFDWGKNYRTIPIEKLKKYKVGVCWDFVNYQHDFLKNNGIKDKAYLVVFKYGDNDNDVSTHTFSVAEHDNKQYWLESAWWNQRGVHEIKSPKEVAQLNATRDGKKFPYDLYEYNPDGMDKGLTDQQFFDKATENLIYTSAKNK